MTDSKEKPVARSKAQIEADLAAARARLTGNVEDLIDQVHPNRIKQRQIATFKQLAKAEVDNAKGQFINADGSPRIDRFAAIGGALAGVITFVVAIKLIIGKSRRKHG